MYPLMSSVSMNTPSSQIHCASNVVDFWAKGPPFRAVIGLVCVLSVMGCLLIIFSYIFFKNLRSRARLLLVHLSIMDLGVGCTNLVGNLIYFDRFYFSANEDLIDNQTDPNYGKGNNASCVMFHQPNNAIIKNLCMAQAFIAHYFTQASILWTISLAVFLYFLIVHHTSKLAKYSLYISYVLCYFLPLGVCIWLLVTKRFGYSPANTGWCSILIINSETSTPDIYAAVFGYDLWIYLAMILVSILYFAVQLYIKEKLRQTKLYLPQAEGKFWEAVHILDYNFIAIPIAFTLLRMWTCIVDLVFVYIHVQQSPLWVNLMFVYLAGIGDSAQGVANAILFVMLTRRVRTTIFSLSYWKFRLKLYRMGRDYSKGELDPLLEEKAAFSRGLTRSNNSYQNTEIYTPTRESFDESNIYPYPINAHSVNYNIDI